jgi:hypothetical protein
MKSSATSVNEYLAELPPDRREVISKLRQDILKVLPEGYEEALNWGMITYQVPLSVYPDTYNKQPFMFAALASQKNYMALYLMSTYVVPGNESLIRDAFKRVNKKLDMGKSCIRFKSLDDLVLEPILDVIASTDMEKFVNAAKKAHSTQK